eukprot:gene8261-9110_t
MSVLAPGIFGNPEKTFELFERYRTSGPYPHANIENICEHDFMRAVHEELVGNMKANFKETDLFKVFQTDELGITEASVMEKTMPHLLKLRTALYSKEFRDFVQQITGCGELTDRVDLSSNAYANSCHLLCHDDVIGTRRISFIIYLSDPDEEWKEEDGGALELYPLDGSSVVFTPEAGPQGIPVAMPTKSILPTFNSIAFFTVLPGRSYHSVQEVFAKDRPRVSISGWYHGPEPQKGADKSSLRLIMSAGDSLPNALDGGEVIQKEDGVFRGISAVEALTEDDVRFLSSFISKPYLTKEGMENIAEQFCDDSSVQLHDFLVSDWAEKVRALIVQLDRQDGLGRCRPSLDHTTGLHAGWELRGPSHKRRYLSYVSSKKGKSESKSEGMARAVGETLSELLQNLLSQDAFARYLRQVTTCIPTASRADIRRFRPGFDYTVAHYGCLTKEARLDATLCFVNDDREAEQNILNDSRGSKDKKKRKKSNGKSVDVSPVDEEDGYDSDYGAVWEDGEVGGFECYIEADQDVDDTEAAEVYKIDTNSRKKGSSKKSEKEEAKKEEEQEEDEEDDAADAEKALLSVSARHNALSLVLRDEGLMKFIKYTSANAPGSRYDISLEYVIEIPEEEEDNDDDDDQDSSNDNDNDEKSSS